MMANWVLVFVLHISGTDYGYYLKEPILLDTFATKQQCESALAYLKETSIGEGNCWGEAK